jgi:DNA-binding PadR family transcriptional regulator
MFREGKFRRERFMRGSRHGHAFHKGDLKYVILDLVKDEPRHGYDIIREIEAMSYGFYKPSPGVVYPTLQMLEEMGYARSNEQDGKKVYSITEEGLEFLRKQNDLADGVRNRMKKRWSFKNIGRMAMVMKEYHALEQLLGQAVRDLDETRTDQIREVLVQAYQEIDSIIQE